MAEQKIITKPRTKMKDTVFFSFLSSIFRGNLKTANLLVTGRAHNAPTNSKHGKYKKAMRNKARQEGRKSEV